MTTLGMPGQIAIGVIAGFLAGLLHYASLWWNARLFAAGAAGKAVALQLGRIAAAVAALTLLARLGFAALSSGAVAFLVARPLLVWRLGALR
jgi:F1F0 ATPase subunit 2